MGCAEHPSRRLGPFLIFTIWFVGAMSMKFSLSEETLKRSCKSRYDGSSVVLTHGWIDSRRAEIPRHDEYWVLSTVYN